MDWLDWVGLLLAGMFGACLGLLGVVLALALRNADDATLGMPGLDDIEDEKGVEHD